MCGIRVNPEDRRFALSAIHRFGTESMKTKTTNSQHGLLQMQAAMAVSKAKKEGLLPILDGSIQCSDCSNVAAVYEHRDYSKPLDVVPVCYACNHARGRALPEIDKKQIGGEWFIAQRDISHEEIMKILGFNFWKQRLHIEPIAGTDEYRIFVSMHKVHKHWNPPCVWQQGEQTQVMP